MKLYVVMENLFDYNDDYYTSSLGGDPLKICVTREAAQKEADRRTRRFVKTLDEHGVGDYMGHGMSNEEIRAIMQLPLKSRIQAFKHNDVTFFYVQEITAGNVMPRSRKQKAAK